MLRVPLSFFVSFFIKTAYARLLDFKQKFLEAGQRYAELSVRFPGLMCEATRMSFLGRALASALLAGAGHQRARLLASLYKDERCQALSVFPILEKMYVLPHKPHRGSSALIREIPAADTLNTCLGHRGGGGGERPRSPFLPLKQGTLAC